MKKKTIVFDVVAPPTSAKKAPPPSALQVIRKITDAAARGSIPENFTLTMESDGTVQLSPRDRRVLGNWTNRSGRPVAHPETSWDRTLGWFVRNFPNGSRRAMGTVVTRPGVKARTLERHDVVAYEVPAGSPFSIFSTVSILHTVPHVHLPNSLLTGTVETMTPSGRRVPQHLVWSCRACHRRLTSAEVKARDLPVLVPR